MSDIRKEVAERVRIQAGWCSPLYKALLERVADDVEASGPAWDVMQVVADLRLRAAPALRLMGAVHRLVLDGALPDLAHFYPSVGGHADAERAWPPFRSALADHEDAVRDLLSRPVQTNEVGRAASLVGGFLTVAGETGLPLRTLEVGASAGLLSRWDHFHYEARGARWGDSSSPLNLCSFNSDIALPFDVDAEVVLRTGCDQSPIDPTTRDGQLTLTSYIWADQVHRVRLMKLACEIAKSVPMTIEKSGAVDWITQHLASPVEGVATVVFHSIVMQYLTDDDRASFESTIRQGGSRATDDTPLAWLRMEPGEDSANVHLTLWPSGKEKLIATTGYHGHDVRWLGW
jgi:hypothetical protein